MPNLPKRKNKYAMRRSRKDMLCPYGHKWTRITGKIGYCAEPECQVAFVCDHNYIKTYFRISEGLVELLEGDLTPEDIIAREKIVDGRNRC